MQLSGSDSWQEIVQIDCLAAWHILIFFYSSIITDEQEEEEEEEGEEELELEEEEEDEEYNIEYVEVRQEDLKKCYLFSIIFLVRSIIFIILFNYFL